MGSGTPDQVVRLDVMLSRCWLYAHFFIPSSRLPLSKVYFSQKYSVGKYVHSTSPLSQVVGVISRAYFMVLFLWFYLHFSGFSNEIVNYWHKPICLTMWLLDTDIVCTMSQHCTNSFHTSNAFHVHVCSPICRWMCKCVYMIIDVRGQSQVSLSRKPFTSLSLELTN